MNCDSILKTISSSLRPLYGYTRYKVVRYTGVAVIGTNINSYDYNVTMDHFSQSRIRVAVALISALQPGVSGVLGIPDTA